MQPLMVSDGGTLIVPSSVLNDRADGGHLVVNPPREVWERSDLTASELTAWSFLVAATGRAMLDVLPHLEGGCINYWEAGNWALNDAAPPAGPKEARTHRRVHLHVFGRSRTARSPDWRWGESPRFPDYVDSRAWAANFAPLDAAECGAVAARAKAILAEKYGMEPK
jgi:diadenosine tetraphosphate (Ap4A) HIT family hydrolase